MSKNICIFSDGTGQGGSATSSTNTNVFRLYNACSGSDSGHQVCFYDPGLGARMDGTKAWTRWVHDILGKATGLGISQNVKDCYSAILEHYDPGDRIFLFGFSRGAYTVRSLGGVLKLCGIPQVGTDGVSPRTSKSVRSALVEEAVEKVYKTYGATDEARQKRVSLGAAFKAKYRSTRASPHFIGVWDTVRALGLPGTSSLIGWRHAFHDASLDRDVPYARHALSIDENREVFEPVIWEVSPQDIESGRVKQVWFAGVHSDVGGAYGDDRLLGDLSLEWMIRELNAIPEPLVIDMEKISPKLSGHALGLQHDETYKRFSLWRIGTREAFHSDPYVQYATIDDFSVHARLRAPRVRTVRGETPYRPRALRDRLREFFSETNEETSPETPNSREAPAIDLVAGT